MYMQKMYSWNTYVILKYKNKMFALKDNYMSFQW